MTPTIECERHDGRAVVVVGFDDETREVSGSTWHAALTDAATLVEQIECEEVER